MCTISWTTRTDGYDLLCNRDESLKRAEAEPPTLRQRERFRFIAPRDPDGGGTWISVNEQGLALCLLNHYPEIPGDGADTAATASLSRGRIIEELATSGSLSAIRDALDSLGLQRFRPFLLLALDAGASPLLWRWDGSRLNEESLPHPPITTSAVDGAHVARLRTRSFQRMRGDRVEPPTVDALYRWHRTPNPQQPHAGVAMQRSDAASVSLTHIHVGSAGVEMRYFPGHPAVTADTPSVTQQLPPTAGTRLPGDRPPRAVEPETFDVRALFHEKNPDMARRLPQPAFALLERLAHQHEINRGIHALRDTPCRQFPARVLEYLGVGCQLHGTRPPAPSRRPIFTANHPLGAVDGLAILAWLLAHYADVRAPVNDVLARVPHLAAFAAPIDKFHRQREASRVLHETFAGDAAVLVFPAGATSRYRNGQLRDGPWEKMPVRMALAHDRPIVPVFIDGRLSWRFYALARARRLLGVRLNLEMLLLVGEMLHPATPQLAITLGQPIPPRHLQELGDTDRDRAAHLRGLCYGLAQPHASAAPEEALTP